jgi:eukaryotic-like serine/threonine-protein kinase
MPLGPGTRLGPYEIVSALGAGGMGEVYRATDTNLKRAVAIKVLPASLSNDPERLARFQREAEVLASLNHPNIAAIYGLEDGDGIKALVMELVDGEDLSERTARGAIPLDDALLIAKQIAEALEAAHEQGIVHRDLKPANIKVRADGTVKVLDFGLAKALEASASGLQPPALSQSPTLTTPAMTQAGLILGTAAYMSPEQAAGTRVDRRADIWAYGVVLWEMLSGQRLFGGDTVVHTLADVLRRSIEFDKLDVPAPIKTVLRRCLDRDAKTRLRDIGEARVAIAKYLVAPASETEIPRRPTRPVYRWVAWAAAAVLAMIAVVGWLRPRPAATGATAADLALTIAPTAGSLTPVGDLHATPEISPDGSAVIFYRDIASAGSGGGVQVRHLNALAPEPVRTGGFRNPGFWSPDSRSFVFSDGTNLKKMRVPDGAPEIIANGVATMVGGSWSDNGTLLVAGAVSGGPGLYVVPAAGGVVKRVEGFPPKDLSFFYWPEFLPGSEDFLVVAGAANIEESEIYLATLRDGRAADPVLLMKNATAVRYTPAGGGRILFVRNDNLYAQTLNRTTRTLEGGPELIQQRVASSPSFYAAHFSVSRTGVVAWRPGTAGLSQVTIFDREGKEIGMAGSPTVVQTLRLAPDEARLLVGFNATAWLLEPGRPGRQQLEQGTMDTLWSPDGSKLLTTSIAGGTDSRIMERSVTGQGTVRELAKPSGLWRLGDISPDGETLLLVRRPLDTTVFSLSLDGVQKEPISLLQTGETISHARFSPDGHWIVYTASAAGSERGGIYTGGGTYVQPYPGPGLRKQVTSRGNYPVWRKDGKEIVYLDEYQGRNYIWSVPLAARGNEFQAGTPSPLFPARLPATTFGDQNFLAVSRDGSRFYIPQALEQPDSDVIHVRMGWAK